MFKRLSVASGVLLLTLAAAPSHALAILDMAVYGGHSYYLLEAASWTDSEAAAVGLGGHLATIGDAAENDFVTQRFGVSNGLFGDLGSLWIGLTDEVTEGTFVWADGTPLAPGDYTNWVPGEPNNYGCTPGDTTCVGEDYVHVPWWSVPGQWNDVPGDVPDHYGVVEVESAVPEPSSLLLLSLGLAGLVGRVRRRR